MRYLIEFENEPGTYDIESALLHLGLKKPIIHLSESIRIEDHSDHCLKRPGIVEKLKKEVNSIDCSLHACAGVGAWDPPYPEVEDDCANF